MAYDTATTVALTTAASVLSYVRTLKQGSRAEGVKFFETLEDWITRGGITAMKFSPLSDFDNDGDAAFDAISNGATTLYGMYIDNSANTAQNYVKLTNATAPTPGTTAPDIIIYIPGTTTGIVTGEGAYSSGRYYHLFVPGIRFATNLSGHCVSAAGTAGTTDPTSAVNGMLIHT